MIRFIHSLAILVVLAALCGGCNDTTKPKTTTPSLTANDTPAHTVSRLIETYERKDETNYANLFTGDYTFEFSNSTDPTLVNQFSNGWFKEDEKLSSLHMFYGYTPPGGVTLPAATKIDINFSDMTPIDDPASADPATNKILTTRVDGSVTVPQSGAEPLTYVMANNLDAFYFVRGDVAVGLDASQPADSDHWYIYRWRDLSEFPSPGPSRSNIEPPTWGKLKAVYR